MKAITDLSAGTASVRITPNASGFLKELEAKLRAMNDPGFTVTIEVAVAQAKADIERFRQSQQRDGVRLGVDADTSKAKDEIAATRAREKKTPFGVNVEADTARARAEIAVLREREQRKALRLRVEFDDADAAGQMQLLQRRLESGGGGGGSGGGGGLGGLGAFGGKFLLPIGGYLAVGAIPSLVSLTANLAKAIQTLGGAGLALPGAFAGVASSVGTAVLGFQGMSDAITALNAAAASGDPKDLEKVAESLKNMAPAAVDVAKAVSGLTPELQGLQKLVAQNMFEGVDKSIEHVAVSTIPAVQKGLGEIGTAWNDTLKKALDVAGSKDTGGFLERLFGNTADAQKVANEAIGPLSNALKTLVGAGSDALPRLSGDIDSVAKRFDAWLQGAAEDGRLDKWISHGITGLENLGNTAVNIGDIFGSIANAGDTDLLGWLDKVTGKFAAYLNSAEGQKAINDLVAEGSHQLDLIGNTLSNLGPVFSAFGSAAASSFNTTNEALSAITDTVNFLFDNIPHLSDLLNGALSPLQAARDALNSHDAQDAAQAKLDAARQLPQPIIAAPRGGLGNTAGIDTSPAADLKLLGSEAYAVQQKVDALGKSVLTLPNGHVILTENTPDVRNKVQALGLELQSNPLTGNVELVVRKDAAELDMQHFVDTWSKAIITPSVVVPGQGKPGGTAGDLLLPAGRAGGGPITGPGVKGRDSVPILAAPGEHMFTASEVDLMGGHANVYKFRAGLHGYAGGGAIIDPYGNPITPGTAPGPATVAPTPTQGGVGNIFGSFLSGIGGPIGQISGLIGNATGGGGAGGKGLTPGFAGLAQAGSDPNLLNQWGQQTGDWLGNFAAKTLTSFGSTLWQGALGMVGLQNSILSPNNVYNQAAQKTGAFVLGQNGPLGNQSQSGSSSSAVPAFDPTSTVHHSGSSSSSAPTSNDPSQIPKGVTGNQAVVYQAMLNAGLGPDQWPALKTLIDHESGFRPTAQNPSSTAYGMFQFLNSTWGTVGGAKTADPHFQAQYGIAYIKQRYGTPSKAWAQYYNHPGGEGSYDAGGWLMPGVSLSVNNSGKPEAILTHDQGLAVQTIAKQAAVPAPSPHPNFQTPNFQQMQPRAQQPPVAVAPTPMPTQTVPQPGPATPTPEAPPPPVASITPGGTGGTGGGQAGTNHTLPWVDKAIESGAAALGNAASMAATFGMVGGGGGGGGGSMISGLFTQGGKIVQGIANVVSSALVGNVPGSFGDPNMPAYGQTLRPTQNVPQTAPLRGSTYHIQAGYKPTDLIDALRLKEAQDAQGTMARYRG